MGASLLALAKSMYYDTSAKFSKTELFSCLPKVDLV